MRPSESSTSDLDVRVIENEDGRLSSQFEGDGSEVLSGGSGDDLADGSGSGVEDMIPLESQQFGRLSNTSGYDGVGAGVEVFGNEGCDEDSNVDSDIGGLLATNQRSV